MDEFKQECKLCDEIISDKNFKVIDDTNYIFGVLLLKLRFDNETQKVMCKTCSSKLLGAFTFKLKCLNVENTIISYVNLENPTILDLKDIYAKENESNQGRVLDDWEVCRLCLHPISSEHRSIQEVPFNSIQVYIPEINFAVTSTPTICINCHDELCFHSTFIRNCLDVEEKRNMNGIKVEDIPLANTLIKTEEIEIKSEEIDEVLLKVEYAERDTTVHLQNGLLDTEEANTSMYKCDECDYECIRQCHLKTHQLTHKDPSELSIYKCDKFKFQTRHRRNLFTHKLRHKDPSEVRIFECDKCDYKSMKKGTLNRHQLTHKDPSEVQMYNCDKCNFKTKHKVSLIQHFLQHRDPLEVPVFDCDECDYKSIYKQHLKKHQLRHKDPSETHVFECVDCDYKSIYKQDLTRHELKHKDPSKVRVFKCDECDYKSIYKRVLMRHKLVHKDPSEMRMFECDECDYKSIYKHLLKQHKLRHKDSSKVLYSCNECGYKTLHRGNFKKHQSRHKDSSYANLKLN